MTTNRNHSERSFSDCKKIMLGDEIQEVLTLNDRPCQVEITPKEPLIPSSEETAEFNGEREEFYD